jgi:hypothetical protein
MLEEGTVIGDTSAVRKRVVEASAQLAALR